MATKTLPTLTIPGLFNLAIYISDYSDHNAFVKMICKEFKAGRPVRLKDGTSEHDRRVIIIGVFAWLKKISVMQKSGYNFCYVSADSSQNERDRVNFLDTLGYSPSPVRDGEVFVKGFDTFVGGTTASKRCAAKIRRHIKNGFDVILIADRSFDPVDYLDNPNVRVLIV